MNFDKIWNDTLAFEFDSKNDNYGFTIRLAKENYWTYEFTQKAILEYKKFMFLAAINDEMVSPSEIVDTVWHQHLIFTKSYNKFCKLLGKKIQHVPSTHNKEDFETFVNAKKRTKELYLQHFGEQDKSIWEYSSMFDSLNLKKSNFKLRTALIIGLNIFIALTIPFYFILKPFYSTVNSEDFFIGIILISLVAFGFLSFYNHKKLNSLIQNIDNSSFVFSLLPSELVFLKNDGLKDSILMLINKMVHDESLYFLNDKLYVSTRAKAHSNEEAVVIKQINVTKKGLTYLEVFQLLSSTPLFNNIPNAMLAFKKYILKSNFFAKLFLLNFSILNVVLLLSFTRIVTGIVRDKPILYITIFTIILTIAIIFYLIFLINLFFQNILPRHYHSYVSEETKSSLDWQFLFLGSVVLAPTLVSSMNAFYSMPQNNSGTHNSCGSGNSDSSCGSSCGSGCGGCGGGD